MKLLTMGFASTKWLKSDNSGLGYLTAGMYLAPYKLSGKNFCPWASAGCIAACLFTSGRGKYQRTKNARMRRSRLFIENRRAFVEQLHAEIARFVLFCRRRGKRPAIRLNGTSDLAWERIAPQLFTDFPEVQFYDYTKGMRRMLAFLNGDMPHDYHLTFSRSEVNEADCIDILSRGGNVAAVFSEMPSDWYGFPVYDADTHDLRFLDPYGVGGLHMKGRARHDRTGFVNIAKVRNAVRASGVVSSRS
jgi:hypothetical protein